VLQSTRRSQPLQLRSSLAILQLCKHALLSARFTSLRSAVPLGRHLGFLSGLPFLIATGYHFNSTFPPEKITPIRGLCPSPNPISRNPPFLNNGDNATALDGSITIFIRSHTNRIAALISSSLTSSTPSTSFRKIANVRGASEARKPSAIVSLVSSDCNCPLFSERYASSARAGSHPYTRTTARSPF